MSELLCCIGTQACSCFCMLFASGCGLPRKTFYRIGYILFSLIWIGIALIILYWAAPALKYLGLSHFISCPSNSFLAKDDDLSCLGVSAVFRVSLVLAIFHFILCLLCLCGGSCISSLNEGAWPLKIIVVLLAYIGSFFISNSVVKAFSYICLFDSFVFQVFEVIILIDLAYTWNNNWVSKYDSTESSSSNEKVWAVLLILFTFLFFAGGIVLIVFIFMYWTTSTSDYICIIIVIVLNTINTGLIFTKIVIKGSLYTSSIVFCITTFLAWSALLAEHPNSSGNPGSISIQLSVGLGFMIVALIFISVTTKDPSKEKAQESTILTKTQEALVENKSPGDDKPADSSDIPQVSLETALFHVLMMVASMYYPMILTNWGNINIYNDHNTYFSTSSQMSFIVKMSSTILAILLYSWSLIAPFLCPNRDFGR